MTNRTKNIAAAVLLLAAIALNFAGCSKVGDGGELATKSVNKTADISDKNKSLGTSNDSGQPAANEIQIVIENFAFVPSELTIAPGTRVTWINKDEAPHTATSTDKKFNSGGLDTDDKFSFVFSDKGEFPYFCALHPHMTATITVK